MYEKRYFGMGKYHWPIPRIVGIEPVVKSGHGVELDGGVAERCIDNVYEVQRIHEERACSEWGDYSVVEMVAIESVVDGQTSVEDCFEVDFVTQKTHLHTYKHTHSVIHIYIFKANELRLIQFCIQLSHSQRQTQYTNKSTCSWRSTRTLYTIRAKCILECECIFVELRLLKLLKKR